ncbi:MAG TPA: class I SAM-dependent methyltransferase [Pyrinomonadaceae bacterium]
MTRTVEESAGSLKEQVRAFWQSHPCGTKFTEGVELGSPEFFRRVEEFRYAKEGHILAAADFASAGGLRVLEIGCGLGTDGVQFARAGADYTGVDLTEAAVELARHNFEWRDLPGRFQTADAENLEFADSTFDLVYSHGVLHHTPDTARAVREVRRVLRPGGRAVVMLYHRDSLNYRLNIGLLRRAGAHLLRTDAGLRLVHRLTGEPVELLEAHAARVRGDARRYFSPAEFLSQNTDGPGNPLARVYSRAEVRQLFKDFAEVETAVHFLNKRWLPVVGPLLPPGVEARLAARWGWHLWIYAKKAVSS